MPGPDAKRSRTSWAFAPTGRHSTPRWSPYLPTLPSSTISCGRSRRPCRATRPPQGSAGADVRFVGEVDAAEGRSYRAARHLPDDVITQRRREPHMSGLEPRCLLPACGDSDSSVLTPGELGRYSTAAPPPHTSLTPCSWRSGVGLEAADSWSGRFCRAHCEIVGRWRGTRGVWLAHLTRATPNDVGRGSASRRPLRRSRGFADHRKPLAHHPAPRSPRTRCRPSIRSRTPSPSARR